MSAQSGRMARYPTDCFRLVASSSDFALVGLQCAYSGIAHRLSKRPGSSGLTCEPSGRRSHPLDHRVEHKLTNASTIVDLQLRSGRAIAVAGCQSQASPIVFAGQNVIYAVPDRTLKDD
jgi:hypothetical protein